MYTIKCLQDGRIIGGPTASGGIFRCAASEGVIRSPAKVFPQIIMQPGATNGSW